MFPKIEELKAKLDANIAAQEALVEKMDTGWQDQLKDVELEFASLETAFVKAQQLYEAKKRVDGYTVDKTMLRQLPAPVGQDVQNPVADQQIARLKEHPWFYMVDGMVQKNTDLLTSLYTANDGNFKDLGVTTSPNGGWMLPPAMSNRFIDVLRDALVFKRLKVQAWPVPDQTLQVPKQASEAEAYWIGDNESITATDFTGGEVTLSLRYIGAAMKISNRLLRSSVAGLVNQRVQDTLIAKIRRGMEIGYLFGSGAVPVGANNNGAQPRGLLNISGIQTFNIGADVDGVTNKLTDGGAPKLVDYSRAMGLLERANIVNFGTRAWVANEGIRGSLREMADENGRQYFIENVSRGDGGMTDMLYGYPIYYTNAIPANITTGAKTDTSYIFFGEWNYFMNGIGPDIELAASTETGDAFLKNQTVIRAFAGCDLNVEQASAFVVMKGVRFQD